MVVLYPSDRVPSKHHAPLSRRTSPDKMETLKPRERLRIYVCKREGGGRRIPLSSNTSGSGVPKLSKPLLFKTWQQTTAGDFGF